MMVNFYKETKLQNSTFLDLQENLDVNSVTPFIYTDEEIKASGLRNEAVFGLSLVTFIQGTCYHTIS